MEEKPVVFILHGDDAFAMAQYVDVMVTRMGDPSIADLNTVRLDGRSASDADIRTAATSMPFLAERRLTVITYPLAKLGAKPAQERFLAFLNSLPETCALVLVQEDSLRWENKEKRMVWSSLPEKHWLMDWASTVGKRALVKSFSLPGPKEMPAWIQKTAREHGGQFSIEAAQELAGLVGSETRVATQEIDKLLTFVNFSRPVEAEDVADCTADISPADVYEMIDLITAGKQASALRVLEDLLEEGEIFGVFGAVVSHIRSLMITREVLNDHGGESEISQYLPNNKRWMARKKLPDQAQLFTLAGLERIYRQLAQMDEDMKTGIIPPALALELFVANLKVE